MIADHSLGLGNESIEGLSKDINNKWSGEKIPEVVKMPRFGLLLDAWIEAGQERPEYVIIPIREREQTPEKHEWNKECETAYWRTIWACVKNGIPFSAPRFPPIKEFHTQMKGFYYKYDILEKRAILAFEATFVPRLVHGGLNVCQKT